VIAKHREFKDYFPDYDESYVPQRKFFWTLYLSLYPDEAKKIIEEH